GSQLPLDFELPESAQHRTLPQRETLRFTLEPLQPFRRAPRERLRARTFRLLRERDAAHEGQRKGRKERVIRQAHHERPLCVPRLATPHPPSLVRDPSSDGGPVRPASAKATAVRRSFSEGGSGKGATAGSPQSLRRSACHRSDRVSARRRISTPLARYR